MASVRTLSWDNLRRSSKTCVQHNPNISGDIHNIQHLPTIRVVTQGYDGAYFLFLLPISATDDGEQVILKLHDFLDSQVWRHPAIPSYGFVSRIFWRLWVGQATLSTLPFLDLEAQNPPQQVKVSTNSPWGDLNGAFHDPSTWRGRAPLVTMYPGFRSTLRLRHDRAMLICKKIKAILIYRKVNKARVVWLLVIMLTLCVISGIISGIVHKSVDDGVKYGGVLFALVAAVEALVFWAFG